MEAVSIPVRYARAHHRHDLRALTYVVLDEGNGGIIRNLNDEGATIQAVASLRSDQIVRLRFELRNPRLRVEARGKVVWANSSGQCGVRFLDVSPRTARQINQWIFGDLLQSIPERGNRTASIFAPTLVGEAIAEDDGLMVSSSSREAISFNSDSVTTEGPQPANQAANHLGGSLELDWLFEPLSGRSLAWVVDSLIVFAALMLFSLVFLSIAHELPKWPRNVGAGFIAAIFVVAFYWGFFHLLGGASMGTRLARMTAVEAEEEESAARFR